jgi:hypothetical protein
MWLYSKSHTVTKQSRLSHQSRFFFTTLKPVFLFFFSFFFYRFPVYEHLKRKIGNDTVIDLLLASGLSKMSASLLTYPHEVIRSRMMDIRTSTGVSFWQTCRTIVKTEGFAGFYAGLPISLVRVIPNTCVTFLTYELVLRWARTNIFVDTIR